MIVVEIVILVATLIAVGVYISAGFRHSWMLYFVLGVWLAALIFSFFSAWNPTVIMRPITLVLIVPITLFDIIVKGNDPPDEKYFNLSSLGVFITAPVFGFRVLLYRMRPDDVWLAMVIITSLSTWLCNRAPKQSFRLRFTVIGTILFVIWLAALTLYPLIDTGEVTSENLSLSLRINAVFFLFLMFFFMGGYTRLGLVKKDFSHAKIFVVAATLMLFSWSARFPELEEIVKNLPFGDKLPNVASAGLVALGPLTGVLLAVTHSRTAAPNKPDVSDG